MEHYGAHFNTLYDNHIVGFPGSAVPAGHNALNFTVTGFNPDSRSAEMYNFLIPSEDAPNGPVRTTDNPGSWWMGMVDVVSRIYNGVDIRAFELPFVVAANAENNNANAATQQLGGLTYVVNWYQMGLQDAIECAVGLIQITIMVQRFTAGIMSNIGGTANVGGPIDVAVVRNGGTVEWVQRKALHI